jgi:hypothetical protein
MPRQHSAETKAKMSASVKRTWSNPQIRESRISGLRAHYAASQPITQVLIRQPGDRDITLDVTDCRDGVALVDLGNQPSISFS